MKSIGDSCAAELPPIIVVMKCAQQYEISGVTRATGRYQIGMMRLDDVTPYVLPLNVTANRS